MNNGNTDLAEQLQNERDFIDAVIQTSGALIVVIDKDGKITRFNKTCEHLTGYTADEVIGRTVFDLFTLPEERENVKNIASRLFSGERMVEFENHWVTKTAEKRYIRWRNSILLDNKGEPAYAVATGIDISDRRKVEQALRESEGRFRGIFDNIAMGIHLVDTSDHFIAVNDYVCRMLGYSKEELIAMDVHHLTAPEDREKSDDMNRMIREKKLKRVAYEKHYLKADGSKFWVNVTVSSIRNEKDMHIGSITTVEDISERKRVELALRRSEELLRLAQQGARVGSFDYDPVKKISEWSPELEVLYGLKPGEYRGSYDQWKELIHPADLPYVESRLDEAMTTGQFETEWRIVQPGGTIRWLAARGQVLKDDSGKPVRMVGVNFDITERKQAEFALHGRTQELAAANRDLESFSYSVSHDLRNPLHTIGSFATFLLEDYADRLDEEGQDYIRRINSGVKKMQTLIDDMLSLSRIVRQEMKRENVDLSAIVYNYLEELKSSHPERHVEFVIQEQVYAGADPRLIHLALENMLRNAWKFTSKKETTRIEFGTVPSTSLGHRVVEERRVSDENESRWPSGVEAQIVYFIRDNGQGFDQKFAEKIFEPFKRVHAENEFSGTGVGLSIVKRVILRHGGRVWAEGEVGKGATFYFTLG
jgi:PAS domain S-box-containing protein